MATVRTEPACRFSKPRSVETHISAAETSELQQALDAVTQQVFCRCREQCGLVAHQIGELTSQRLSSRRILAACYVHEMFAASSTTKSKFADAAASQEGPARRQTMSWTSRAGQTGAAAQAI
eukprot:13726-Heterococcus_DN1.PRE.2